MELLAGMDENIAITLIICVAVIIVTVIIMRCIMRIKGINVPPLYNDKGEEEEK